MFDINDEQVGTYLRSAILARYESIRRFCRDYLELRDGEAESEEIRKLLNRFSQILNGRKRIQIDDLPYISELLGISFEDILSAGSVCRPSGSHVTNYDIAFSKDKDIWNRYMNREDKLFLNSDEYNRTVIDYALEFKNYDFIKYLIEEKFIWFVDMSQWKEFGFTYGAGTSIKRKDICFVDTKVPDELRSQDRLRTQTIALAIEHDDFDILDSLRAREVPEMHLVHMFGPIDSDFQKQRNDNLIKAVALASDRIVDYFSQEFVIEDKTGRGNTFLFPYLGAVIETMIANKKDQSAELLIRRAAKHNRAALSKLKKLIDESLDYFEKTEHLDQQRKDSLKKEFLKFNFHLNRNCQTVSYYYMPARKNYIGFVTNIIHADTQSANPLMQELLEEMNGIYDQIAALEEGV